MAFLLLVKIGPLRDLVIRGLDQLKASRRTVNTVAGTVVIILVSYLSSLLRIQNKGVKHGTMTPMDQVLWRTNLLEATLMGFSLFLLFLLDRMHHYMRKLIKLRSTSGVSKQAFESLEKEILQLKEKEEKAVSEVKRLQKEMSRLSETLNKLKMEAAEKDKKIETAEAHVTSLQKQAEDMFLEYDRLLEENQNLQRQALGDQP